jgi:hypothetical protein
MKGNQRGHSSRKPQTKKRGRYTGGAGSMSGHGNPPGSQRHQSNHGGIGDLSGHRHGKK